MKDAYYFPHDSNAKDDPKLSLVIEDYKLEGYGAYWVIIESMRDQSDFRLPYSMIKVLARKYNCDFNIMDSVIRNYDLFVLGDEYFHSNSLTNRMKNLEESRKKRAEAGRKGGFAKANNQQNSGNATTMPEQSHSIFVAVKESKVKESKVNKVNESKVYDFVSDDFKQILIDWLDYKKARKESYKSEKSVEAFYDKLKNLSSGNPARAEEIIQQSMANNWAGIFELKNKQISTKLDPNGDFKH